MKYTIEKLFISGYLKKGKQSITFFLKIEVQLLYNLMLVSTVQQSESATCIHIHPSSWAFLPLPHHRAPSKSSPSTQLSFCATEQLHTTYLLYTWYCIYATTISQCIPAGPHLPNVHISVLYIWVSIPALQIGSSLPLFYIPHTCLMEVT